MRVGQRTTLGLHYDQLLQESNAQLEEHVAQRTAELETANRLKDEFLAMISHELRTTLTGVLSLSELLQEQVAGRREDRGWGT